MRYLGSHVGLSSPLYLLGSVRQAELWGETAFMCYTGAPQNSHRVPLERLKIAEADAVSALPRVIHAPYIVNLADPEGGEKLSIGKKTVKNELQRAKAMGGVCLVLHPGASLGADFLPSALCLCRCLEEVAQGESFPPIAIETMAGKGSEIGKTLEEVAFILSNCSLPLKVCLDTCHLHDGGYDLSDPGFLDEVDRVIGLSKVACVHLNDSKNPRGSHKDRHENLGYGAIGFSNLWRIASDPRLDPLPIILETPYWNGAAPYAQEIKMLRDGAFSDWR